jgi:hypothetical protein
MCSIPSCQRSDYILLIVVSGVNIEQQSLVEEGAVELTHHVVVSNSAARRAR